METDSYNQQGRDEFSCKYNEESGFRESNTNWIY